MHAKKIQAHRNRSTIGVSVYMSASQRVPGSGNDLFGSMKVNKQLATSTTAVLYTTAVYCIL